MDIPDCYESETPDSFGLGVDTLVSHYKSIANSVPNLKRRISLQTRNSTLNDDYNAHEIQEDTKNIDHLHEYQIIINDLETKLSCLKTENETLKNEIKEQINNNEKIQHKNISLLQRIQSIEEQNSFLETSYKKLLNEEQEKHVLQVERAQESHRVYRDCYIEQYNLNMKRNKLYLANKNLFNKRIKNLESQLESNKIENKAYIKQIKELDKQIKELTLDKEDLNQQIIDKEKLIITERNLSTKQNFNLRKEIEKENEILKQEIESLNSNLEILSSKMHSNLDDLDSNSLLSNYFNFQQSEQQTVVKNEFSFKNEINSSTSEELIKKIDFEKQNSDSLTNYISKLKLKIIQNFPTLFDSKLQYRFENLNNKLLDLEIQLSNSYHLTQSLKHLPTKEIELKKLIDQATVEQQKSQYLKEFIDDLIPIVIEDCPKIFEIKSNNNSGLDVY